GAAPLSGLIFDRQGRLYGTTSAGGIHNGGTVFALVPNAARTRWVKRLLYRFCARGGKSCTDGATPMSGLLMDAAGNLYGTTQAGGAAPGPDGTG
ncbi:MAG: choice-of-anchor tandem repeat GloVer-containing protein, partial [Stellaceae bacterium]